VNRRGASSQRRRGQCQVNAKTCVIPFFSTRSLDQDITQNPVRRILNTYVFNSSIPIITIPPILLPPVSTASLLVHACERLLRYPSPVNAILSASSCLLFELSSYLPEIVSAKTLPAGRYLAYIAYQSSSVTLYRVSLSTDQVIFARNFLSGFLTSHFNFCRRSDPVLSGNLLEQDGN
jgi:hypothetical protein